MGLRRTPRTQNTQDKVSKIVFVTLAAAGLSACSSGGSGGDAAHAKIAFLMPDIASTRYELYDSPLFKAKVGQLCPGCFDGDGGGNELGPGHGPPDLNTERCNGVTCKATLVCENGQVVPRG